MCRSIRLPRPQRPNNTEDKPGFGRAPHQALPEAKSLRRDDGPGQAVMRVVDASNDAITLSADWPACSSHEPHQATALRRSRTEASARRVDDAKKGLTLRGPLQKPRMQNKASIRVSHHGHTGTTRHSPRNGFTAYFALSSVTTLFDTVACASSHRLDANDWGVGTTRLHRTQADRARLARCPRPPHPAPR